MNTSIFVAQLSALQFADVFNPYRDCCSDHDHRESPSVRRFNLQCYLEDALRNGVDSVWLGRDCGYRGGRRTGIALTDEVHLNLLQSQFGISGIEKATVGAPMKERTATEVWKLIRHIEVKVFLWNLFPFHPFESGDPMSNRRHTSREFEACRELLCSLLKALRPRKIIALGVDAYKGLERLGFKSVAVRHPSYGGHVEFGRGICRAYECGQVSPGHSTLLPFTE